MTYPKYYFNVFQALSRSRESMDVCFHSYLLVEINTCFPLSYALSEMHMWTWSDISSHFSHFSLMHYCWGTSSLTAPMPKDAGGGELFKAVASCPTMRRKEQGCHSNLMAGSLGDTPWWLCVSHQAWGFSWWWWGLEDSIKHMPYTALYRGEDPPVRRKDGVTDFLHLQGCSVEGWVK